MKTKLRKASLILIGILCLTLIWIYRPYSKYDPKKLSPELTILAEPLQTIEGSSYLDGGTVTIQLVDSKGAEQFFCFPADSRNPKEHHKSLFIGAEHHRDEGAVQIPYSEDTKLRLLELLRSKKSINRFEDVAIFHLSNRSRDAIRILVRKFITRSYTNR